MYVSAADADVHGLCVRRACSVRVEACLCACAHRPIPLSEGAGERDDDQRGHGVAHEHDGEVGPHTRRHSYL